jgi:hypothetical protein
MELIFAINRLSANTLAIAALVRSAADTQARWKPAPESWSILEVIGHLYDEEREDFRQRVDCLLHRPEADFPPIDPQGWVTARAYNQRAPRAALEAFLEERDRSLQWLRTLDDANWASAKAHPAGGMLTAGDMLAAWVAHDHLHLRQLNELHWQYLATQVQSFSLEYAGGW